MPFFQVQHTSQALQRAIGLWVVVPDGPGPFPAVYQLHGLSDDHTIWHRRTAIERHADQHRLIVAMPDGGRSFYCDHPGTNDRYEQHLLETVQFVERTFRAIPKRASRGIGGLSMGGYGAMKMGLKHPGVFASVVSHSSVFDIRKRHAARVNPELDRAFPTGVPVGDDPFRQAAALRRRRAALPRLRIDCGVDDYLIEDNRRFHAHLAKLGIAHEYDEYPGAHEWGYWDARIGQALAFHAGILKRR